MYNFLSTVASYLHPSFKEPPVSQIELEAEQFFESSKPISISKSKTAAYVEEGDEDENDDFKHYKQDVLLRQRADKNVIKQKLSSSAPAATSYISQDNFTNMQYRNFSHYSHYSNSPIENTKQILPTSTDTINDISKTRESNSSSSRLQQNLTSNSKANISTTPPFASSSPPLPSNIENQKAWNSWFKGTYQNEQELDNQMEQTEIDDFSKQILDLNSQSKTLQFESRERQKYQQIITKSLDEEVAKLRQNKSNIKE